MSSWHSWVVVSASWGPFSLLCHHLASVPLQSVSIGFWIYAGVHKQKWRKFAHTLEVTFFLLIFVPLKFVKRHFVLRSLGPVNLSFNSSKDMSPFLQNPTCSFAKLWCQYFFTCVSTVWSGFLFTLHQMLTVLCRWMILFALLNFKLVMRTYFFDLEFMLFFKTDIILYLLLESQQ